MIWISIRYISKPPWVRFAGNIIAITGVNGCCLQQTFRFNHSAQWQQIQIQIQFIHITNTNTNNHNSCTKVKILWLSKNDVLCDCARCNGSWRCAARKPAISLSKGARPLEICEPITKNICQGGNFLAILDHNFFPRLKSDHCLALSLISHTLALLNFVQIVVFHGFL